MDFAGLARARGSGGQNADRAQGTRRQPRAVRGLSHDASRRPAPLGPGPELTVLGNELSIASDKDGHVVTLAPHVLFCRPRRQCTAAWPGWPAGCSQIPARRAQPVRGGVEQRLPRASRARAAPPGASSGPLRARLRTHSAGYTSVDRRADTRGGFTRSAARHAGAPAALTVAACAASRSRCRARPGRGNRRGVSRVHDTDVGACCRC